MIIDSSICVAVIDRLPVPVAVRMIRFCDQRHLLGRQLDAEVAARDHDAVRRLDDRVDCSSA